MRNLKIITAAIAIGSLMALGACKKDDKKKEGEGDTAGKKTTDGDGDNPCAGKNPCGGENPCAGKNPCGGGDMSMDDKKKMAGEMVGMMEKLGKAMEDNAEDCAKMAEGITAVADGHKELIEKMKSMSGDDKKDPEFEKWFNETHGEAMKKTMTAAMGAMMKKCGQDEGVKKAFEGVMPK